MKIVSSGISPLVIGFGRFNPPTIGHQSNFDCLNTTWQSVGGASFMLVSRSYGHTTKNLLSPKEKYKFLDCSFSGTPLIFTNDFQYSIFQILQEMWKRHDHLYYICGSDRVEYMTKTLNYYNNKDYFFTEINVVCSGERNHVSSTLMLECIKNHDYEGYLKLVPANLLADSEKCQEMYEILRQRIDKPRS